MCADLTISALILDSLRPAARMELLVAPVEHITFDIEASIMMSRCHTLDQLILYLFLKFVCKLHAKFSISSIRQN